MSRFEPGEKVIIFAKKHEFYGRLARILKVQTHRHTIYKLRIRHVDIDIWFSEEFLRPIRYLGVTKAPEKKDFIRVVDVKGDYATHDVIGRQGELSYVDPVHATMEGNDNYVHYLQLGDYELVPNKKTAWVVRSRRIYREKLTRVISERRAQCQWLTSDGYIISDTIVFDDIVDALDYASNHIPSIVNNIKVNIN